MNTGPGTRRKHRWPHYLLAAVLLGIVLGILAVLKEAQRIRELKGSDPLYPKPSGTPSAQH